MTLSSCKVFGKDLVWTTASILKGSAISVIKVRGLDIVVHRRLGERRTARMVWCRFIAKSRSAEVLETLS